MRERNDASLVERVRRRLADVGGLDHVHVRMSGPHVLVIAAEAVFARLTSLGHGAFGIAFRERDAWQPIALVDTLDEIVSDMIAALPPATATEYVGFAAE
jgi:hypothetical protein